LIISSVYFFSNADCSFFKVENYGIFPKQFADIISKFNIDELRLSLAQGTWKYDKWGLPIVSAPSGGEYIALFSQNLNETE
jgi:hypothetical protein